MQSKKFKTWEVEGEKLNFYPLSLSLTFRLQSFAEPMAKLFASIFENKQANKTDTGSITRSVAKVGEIGSDMKEFIVHPINSDLAALRHNQRTEAITQFCKAFAADNNRDLLCEIIIDSLREKYPEWRKTKDKKVLADFIADLDFGPFVECMCGVAAANVGVFGPLLAKAGINTDDLAEKMMAKAKALADEQLKTHPNKTGGESSTTKSTGQSKKDTVTT